jgi:alkane 1-monooxygenase
MAAMTSVNTIDPDRFRFSSSAAAFFSHLRYSLQNIAFLLGIFGLLAGGIWLWLPFIAFVVAILIGNVKFKLDISEPENPPYALHNFLLRAALPLLLTNALLFAHYFTNTDPLHIVAGLKHVGVNLDAARASTYLADRVLGIFAQGFYWGIGQTAGHELCHRLNSRLDLGLARWIGGLALDPVFNLHHPFCHHRQLGLLRDPGTARRGDNLYGFTIRCAIGNTLYAAQAEAERMRQNGRPVFSPQNRFITAWGICLLYLGVFIVIAGPLGGLVFLAAGCFSRLLLESTAYVEHYGLFRLEGGCIDNRLSWDVYTFFSNAILYNVARHTDHHLHPQRHCADLKIDPGAPRLNHGYIALVLISLVPPLYWRIMQPHLDDWDREFATPAELAYLRDHNIPRAEPLPSS